MADTLEIESLQLNFLYVFCLYIRVLALNKISEAVSRAARWSLLLSLFSF